MATDMEALARHTSTMRRMLPRTAASPCPASHRTPASDRQASALITCNTSAVAVCCSSASRCSVMQPRVLHRDHRLGGEVLQQRDLLVGEWPHLLAVDALMQPSKALVLAQRHRQSMSAHPCSSTSAAHGSPYRFRFDRSADRQYGRTRSPSHEPPVARLVGTITACRTNRRMLSGNHESPAARRNSSVISIKAPERGAAQTCAPFPGSPRTPAPDCPARR